MLYSIDYKILRLPPAELSSIKNRLRLELEKMGYEYEDDYQKAFKLHGSFLSLPTNPENITCFLNCKDNFTLNQLMDDQLWVRYIYHPTGNPLITAPDRIKTLTKKDWIGHGGKNP